MSLIVRGPKGRRSWGSARRLDAGPLQGNRRVNNAMHSAAVVQLCENSDGRASRRRKRAEAKRPNLDWERIAPVRLQVSLSVLIDSSSRRDTVVRRCGHTPEVWPHRQT